MPPVASATIDRMAAQRERPRDREPDDTGTDDENIHCDSTLMQKRRPEGRRSCKARFDRTRQAAIDICGAAARTSASTWSSKRLKFSLNMSTRRLAVSANAALSCQVLTG